MPQPDLAVVTGAFSYTGRYRKGCRTTSDRGLADPGWRSSGRT